MNLLEQDLLKNADDRLEQWIRDTIMRCEAVNLDADVAFTILLTCMMRQLAVMHVHLGIKLQDFLTIMQNSFQGEIQKIRREAGKSP